MIHWQSVIPQRVSGVFTPIIRRADACHCLWFPVLAMVVVVLESRVARCVYSAEDKMHGQSEHKLCHQYFC
jgi:hypothetical protein